jgi:hypothetical protein
MALLGEAFVRVRPDTDGFQQEAERGLGGGLRKVAGLVAATFSAVKVGGFLKDGIQEASDYGETVSKVANVFGSEITPELTRFAATAPRAFGISENAALAASAQFGNMFRQLGFTSQAAAGASTNLVKTAADLGSFNNVDPSDVLERIGAALRGEFDSLQQLIPNINAARVEQEALAATGKESAKQLTAQEKATATLAIIQKDGALAADDFTETQASLANQQRILAATVDGLQKRLGTALLPAVTAVTTYLASNAEPAFDRAEATIRRFAEQVRTSSGTGGEFRAAFDAGREAVTQLIASVRSGEVDLPSFSGLLDLTAGTLRLLADNADLVVKALPFLAAGFVVVKTAQAAANVAMIASLPLQAAQVGANIAGAIANNRLAAAIAQQTAIQNVNAVATTRGTVATVASTVAQTAAAAASKVLAAGQVVLNAVLAANPIGLVVVAIAAFVAGLVLAYNKSETFRTIVNGALDAVKGAFLALGGAALSVIDKLLAGYQAVAAAAGRLPGPLGAPFRAAEEAIGKARQGVQNLQGTIDGLKGKTVNIDVNVRGINNIDRGLDAALAGRLQGRAGGGPVRRNTPYKVGERGTELFIPSTDGQIIDARRTSELLSRSQGDSGDLQRAMLEELRALRRDTAALPGRLQQAGRTMLL